MKLPGIQQGSVQSLGRYDTSAPVKAAASEVRANEAEAGVVASVSNAYRKVYEDESTRQALQAANAFDLAYQEQEAVQTHYTEDGKSSWGSREKIYDEMMAKATGAANETEMTGLAQEKLRAYQAKKHVQYKAAWDNKVDGWWHDDGVKQVQASSGEALKNKDWDGAIDVFKAGAEFIGGAESARAIEGVKSMRSVDRFLTYVDSIDVTKSGVGAGIKEYNANVEADTHLSKQDKKGLIAARDAHIVEASADRALLQMTEVFKAQGAIAAVNAGKATQQLVLLADTDANYGGDVLLQNKVIDGIKKETRYFEDLVQKTSTEQKKLNDIYALLSGQLLPGQDSHVKVINDTYEFLTGDDDQRTLSNEPTFQSLKDSSIMVGGPEYMAQQFSFYNKIPDKAAGLLSAALESGDPALASSVFDTMEHLEKTDRGLQVLNVTQGNGAFMQVRALQALNLGNKTAYKWYQKGREVDPEVLKTRTKALDTTDNNEWFTSAFPKAVENMFPVDGKIWFTTVSPQIRSELTTRARGMMMKQMALYGVEDLQQGLKMTMALLKPSMAIRTVQGKSDLVPVEQTIQAHFMRPGHTVEQTEAWVGQSLQAQFAKDKADGLMAPDFSKPYSYIMANMRTQVEIGGRMVPHEYPVVQVTTIDSHGYTTIWPGKVPLFRGTDQQKLDFRKATLKAASDKSIAEATAVTAGFKKGAMETGEYDTETALAEQKQFALEVGVKVKKALLGHTITMEGQQQDFSYE